MIVNRSGPHPWADLEGDFQDLIDHYVRLDSVPAATREGSAARIWERAYGAAVRNLRVLSVPGPFLEAQDAADDLFAVLLSYGFSKIDDRPAHPYAYQVLRYLCFARARKIVRADALPETLEDRTSEDPLREQVLYAELCEVIDEAATCLSPKRREALLKSLDRDGARSRSATRREAKREASLLYHARRQLRASIAGYLCDGSRNSSATAPIKQASSDN